MVIFSETLEAAPACSTARPPPHAPPFPPASPRPERRPSLPAPRRAPAPLCSGGAASEGRAPTGGASELRNTEEEEEEEAAAGDSVAGGGGPRAGHRTVRGGEGQPRRGATYPGRAPPAARRRQPQRPRSVSDNGPERPRRHIRGRGGGKAGTRRGAAPATARTGPRR